MFSMKPVPGDFDFITLSLEERIQANHAWVRSYELIEELNTVLKGGRRNRPVNLPERMSQREYDFYLLRLDNRWGEISEIDYDVTSRQYLVVRGTDIMKVYVGYVENLRTRARMGLLI